MNSKRIKDVAEMFRLPVHTLHYWEKEGLFHIRRGKDNKYRYYELGDILNIWEIALYRELDIPISDIKTIFTKNLDGMLETYKENEVKLTEQITKLEQKRKRLQDQIHCISEVNDMKKIGVTEALPDFHTCKLDPFDNESIKLTIMNTYRCCLLISGSDYQIFSRGIQVETCAKDEILWSYQQVKNEHYLQFLLKVNMNDMNDNNIRQVLMPYWEQGIKTGDIIARYLTISGEEKKRYEYYKAWVQILNVN